MLGMTLKKDFFFFFLENTSIKLKKTKQFSEDISKNIYTQMNFTIFLDLLNVVFASVFFLCSLYKNKIITSTNCFYSIYSCVYKLSSNLRKN